MTNRGVVDNIKERLSLVDFLRDIGYAEKYGLRWNGTKGSMRCPFHDDTKPSMVVKETHAICFAQSCQKSYYDIFDFYQHAHGVGFVDAVKGLAQLCGINGAEVVAWHGRVVERDARWKFAQQARNWLSEQPEVLEWLRGRGVRNLDSQIPIGFIGSSLDVAQWAAEHGVSDDSFFQVLINTDWRGVGRLVFFYEDVHHNIVGVKVRVPFKDGSEKQEWFVIPPHGECAFGLFQITPHQPVILVEGEIDAMALWSIGWDSVVCGAGGLVGNVVSLLAKKRVTEIWCLPDADKGGIHFALKAAITAGRYNIPTYIPFELPYPEGKDPADWVVEGLAEMMSSDEVFAVKVDAFYWCAKQTMSRVNWDDMKARYDAVNWVRNWVTQIQNSHADELTKRVMLASFAAGIADTKAINYGLNREAIMRYSEVVPQKRSVEEVILAYIKEHRYAYPHQLWEELPHFSAAEILTALSALEKIGMLEREQSRGYYKLAKTAQRRGNNNAG